MTTEQISRLVLGTVQLGMPYGAVNRTGMPERADALRILETAWQAGIRRFDTAPGYGSEALIGEFIAAHGLASEARVITKVPPIQTKAAQALLDAIRRGADQSRRIMRLSTIDTLLLHGAADAPLLAAHGGEITGLPRELGVRRLGASVYAPEQASGMADLPFPAACQFPMNVFDRRFVGLLPAFVERYCRSVFLQGLLLSDDEPARPIPTPLRELLHRYHRFLRERGVPALAHALAFAFSHSSSVDFVLVGAERVDQVQEIVLSTLEDAHDQSFDPPPDVALLVDPRTW